MKKNYLILIICVLILIVLLWGCQSKSKTKNNSSPRGKKQITLLGTISEDEVPLFEGCFDSFEEKTGITLKYESTKEFENLISIRVESGNAPDIAMFSSWNQNLAEKYIKSGKIVKLDQDTAQNIQDNYSSGWHDIMSYNKTFYGVVHSANIKSLVIYPKKAWKKAGWTIPVTWEELETLCDRMVSEGETPWAVGLESGGASGWTGTDWIEDIVLRTAGPAQYDRWISGELPFSSPEIKRAFEILDKMWLTPGYVYGGPEYINETFFGDAPKILFENPPKAWMHRQGNFIPLFLPDHIKNNIDQEIGVFLLPPIDPQYKVPVTGAYLVLYAFNKKPEVRDFLYYVSTGESTVHWARSGGALFPHLDQDLKDYPNQFTRELTKILMTTDAFRVDGSDLMSPEIGVGSFWTEMLDFVNGKDIGKVLADIDASRL